MHCTRGAAPCPLTLWHGCPVAPVCQPARQPRSTTNYPAQPSPSQATRRHLDLDDLDDHATQPPTQVPALVVCVWQPEPMPTPARPGSTSATRRLRLYVLARDQYLCQACPEPHPLTTHDKALPTHATLGHKRGREWAATRATSLDPDDYRAECARANYSHGAAFGNARRADPSSSCYYVDPDF